MSRLQELIAHANALVETEIDREAIEFIGLVRKLAEFEPEPAVMGTLMGASLKALGDTPYVSVEVNVPWEPGDDIKMPIGSPVWLAKVVGDE